MMTSAGSAVLSMLTAMPRITFVPWPVSEASAMARTGAKFVAV